MKVKVHNPNTPNEDIIQVFDEKLPLVITLDFDNETISIRQEPHISTSGDLARTDVISFIK